MQLIDTHTHLSAEAYTEGGAAMVEAAIAAGVVMMILPGTSLEELPAMKRLAAQFPRHLRMFAGLHPTELTADPEAAVAVIRREIEENPGLYVGVGEIGIDLHESPHDADRQMRAFDAQCRIALDHGLPSTSIAATDLMRRLKCSADCLRCPQEPSIASEAA